MVMKSGRDAYASICLEAEHRSSVVCRGSPATHIFSRCDHRAPNSSPRVERSVDSSTDQQLFRQSCSAYQFSERRSLAKLVDSGHDCSKFGQDRHLSAVPAGRHVEAQRFHVRLYARKKPAALHCIGIGNLSGILLLASRRASAHFTQRLLPHDLSGGSSTMREQTGEVDKNSQRKAARLVLRFANSASRRALRKRNCARQPSCTTHIPATFAFTSNCTSKQSSSRFKKSVSCLLVRTHPILRPMRAGTASMRATAPPQSGRQKRKRAV